MWFFKTNSKQIIWVWLAIIFWSCVDYNHSCCGGTRLKKEYAIWKRKPTPWIAIKHYWFLFSYSNFNKSYIWSFQAKKKNVWSLDSIKFTIPSQWSHLVRNSVTLYFFILSLWFLMFYLHWFRFKHKVLISVTFFLVWLGLIYVTLTIREFFNNDGYIYKI